MRTKNISTSYEHTIYACYIGFITQAIINNYAPLLFLTFQNSYNLTIDRITLITTVNFSVQLLVDLISTKLVDKIGYRVSAVCAHLFAGLGLFGMAFLPDLSRNAYMGLIASVVLYAIGGGLIEVIISPIVEACPTEKKEAAMSLLHSFYCWGQVGVVLVSTAFFAFAGIDNWKILACIWAVIPFANLFYFTQVPLYPIVEGDEGLSVRELFSRKVFWLFLLLMVCAGASEQAMSQWSSAFAEAGLKVSKTAGDLAGPMTFAVLMGIARAIYGKFSDYIPLRNMMMLSAGLCIVSYSVAALSGNAVLGFVGCALCGFSVGIFWPGTFSIAAKKLPAGGTAMYAIMALAGDFGCSAGPTLVGLVANAKGGMLSAGLLTAMIFPVLMLTGLLMIKNSRITKNV
ncbi:major facilitator superfamily MFS_1 [Thermoclostridium stercorarium subsp. stercorarium DSM 8532]|jgi:fucose permease|uniref:Major facilitator superfamily MFS_1 n=3 Tax=Thermoclostridium stercorarium TaxID=1510 RepID=L7VQP1_THES1|nr:MFS transporter [Thermoclostridium stercorarium]AGC68706.1 major facilitator superfamily MFS_1 [Thermoclostridium stercorarium subsp. stercorarium DSM 8532]AGI39715.1 major facilitator superfamily protein [Thermoclostridium stercorarium subsp. stercorarium DSM 8532]ANW99039.1 fucose permease [Thermoclostridium stercorarium subsp. thermolacticum DSM 2910]ANX01567.1 fucose permease [Thermoclostridium stercorarium subsp. leptospartum DSM 9219]UZQ84685.1 MFS transporter [Thermoclostridium sterc